MRFIMEMRYRRFCNEYMIDINATRAAIRSGYKRSGAKWTGCRLLKRKDVQQILDEIRKEICMGRPSSLQAMFTIQAEEARQEYLNSLINPSTRSKHKVMRLNSIEQLPEILNKGNLSNKELQTVTGKDKGHISRLLNAENMNMKTFLELCEAMELEVFVRYKDYD